VTCEPPSTHKHEILSPHPTRFTYQTVKKLRQTLQSSSRMARAKIDFSSKAGENQEGHARSANASTYTHTSACTHGLPTTNASSPCAREH